MNILSPAEVRSRTRQSRTQIWRKVKAGNFPAPVELGPNSIGFIESEIDDWIASRPRRTYSEAA
jgi:prophage regulatory protein